MNDKVRRLGFTAIAGLFLGATLMLLPASVRGASQPTSYIYWDENERVLFYNNPSTTPVSTQTYCNPVPGDPTCVVQNYDANGQMCINPDGSGSFTTGYNPTGTGQESNPGFSLPRMSPPVGEVVWDIHGNFTGTTIYVPGPYKGPWEVGARAGEPGGDIPADPASNPPSFNNDGTMTGCVFDSSGNLFAVDLGSSQGNFPPNDTGRLIEWYKATGYTTDCILYGPNAGGDVPTGTMGLHHVDGSGGLFQPGQLARDSSDNIYLPVDTFTGAGTNAVPNGEVLRFMHTDFPADASTCHNSIDQTTGNNVHADEFHQGAGVSGTPAVFIQGSAAFLPLPAGIARDTVCGCWAVSDVIGNPAVAFYSDTGTVMPARSVPAPATTSATYFNPYGIASDPMGNLFAVDIHLTQGCSPETNPTSCAGLNIGPQDKMGQLLEFPFVSNTNTFMAATVIGSGYSFPVSVTSCNPQTQNCPTPAPAVVFPESPWVPALLIAGAGLGYLVWRRQRGSCADAN